ncbi:DUF4348 domain-containing protein [Phocaeicola paurosaccharolyticus]|jgi:hypothetical protein|uniref:DUF4348 domain-containing protein n=1 Tax=Phocaeicola paurosaccharolyticus TaxID=732242 RepID=UPI00046AA033|nr:DUF4348 domain-containing protein [Phocaeicola paurosaccharolyticus]
MRKLVYVVFMLLLVSGCTGNKQKMGSSDELSKQTDSLDSAKDSIVDSTEIAEGDIIPPSADESFADFFYNFAIDKKLQKSRIVFPLAYYKENKKESIQEKQWKHDPMMSRLASYTVFYDEASQMEMEKDTSINSVKIEWRFLKNNKIKTYYFQRVKGVWKLEAIDLRNMAKTDDDKEDFYDFYKKFAADSLFQEERLASPLKFVTVDPDDEFQILETTLEQGQWFAFKPQLPTNYLTNVIYGQSLSNKSNSRVMELKGFGNGFNNTLYFERRNGKWKLTQFEDLSD